MSDTLEDFLNIIIFALLSITLITLFTKISYIGQIDAITPPEIISLPRYEFETIYQHPDLSACLWVNDTALQETKELIAPSEIISNAMLKKCESAKDSFFINTSLFLPGKIAKESLINYIYTKPWMIRYKIIFPEWENHLDSQLKNAMDTW